MRTKPSELRSAPVSWRYLKLVASLLFQLIEAARNLLSVLVEDADLFVRQIVRIGLHLRDEILLDQRRRHGPERIEIDLGRLGLHDRRLAIDLADAGGVMRIDDAVFDRLDRGGGNVHHHDSARQDRRYRPSAERYWSASCCRRAAAGTLSSVNVASLTTPVWLRPWRAWKRLTAASTNESKTGPVPATGSRSPEATRRSPQRLHGLRFGADPEFGAGRHRVPAAAGDDVLIFLDRRFRRVDRRRRQDGGRLAPDRHVRRRLIALRPFRLSAILIFGLGRDRSQGDGKSYARRRGKQCAA